MPADPGGREVITLPYSSIDDAGSVRPYLWIDLIGLNGRRGSVPGLIDTGADTTVLPKEFAALMGYGVDQLQTVQIGQVSGSADAFHARIPCRASVVGIEHYTFDLRPMFVETQNILLGREDFLMAFGLVLDEPQHQFSLILPLGVVAPG